MQNILIADDHSIVRAGLKLLINSCIRDITIDEAEDGEAVIKKMKSASFDLLILDIVMPDRVNGFALARMEPAMTPAARSAAAVK